MYINVVLTVQINQEKRCKSHFPYSLTNKSTIKVLKRLNERYEYRIMLRRNHEWMNQLNIPIMNFWRANMDVQMLCKQAISSIVYVTYYTSKIDKASDVKDALVHLVHLAKEAEKCR